MAEGPPVLALPSSPPLIGTGFGTEIETETESNTFQLDTLPSSDPPFFSSDDLQSSTVENYYPKGPSGASVGDNLDIIAATTPDESVAQRARRKRAYRGTWWGEEITPKRTRRTGARTRTAWKDKGKVDSGVFMPSDDDVNCTDNDMCPCGPYTPSPTRSTAVTLLPVCSTPVRGRIDRRIRCQELREPESIICARDQISRCLEEGDDRVDLSYHHLKEIPTDFLKPLTALVKQPAAEIESSPPEHYYAPLVPRFHLFLNANNLTTVNPVIFELKRFGTLNLFRNELSTIPDSIENVETLWSLNVAANQLRTLPWSIMRLINQGKLKRLIAHPNPFVRMDGVGGDDDVRMIERFWDTSVGYEATGRTPHRKPSTPVLVVRSRIDYFNGEGNHLPYPPTSPSSYSRSLRETALQTYIRAAVNVDKEAGQLLPDLPPSDAPNTQDDDRFRLHRILPMLERAVSAQSCGGSLFE
ncbi:hypothetical protein KEM54_004893 [Ascosphaera aggregata]|nr:hypothetical protein KEM54_004893 [Ascosphaera aggregata]